MCFVYFGSGDLVSVTDGSRRQVQGLFLLYPKQRRRTELKGHRVQIPTPPVGSKDGCWKRQGFHPVHYNMRQLFIDTKVRDKSFLRPPFNPTQRFQCLILQTDFWWHFPVRWQQEEVISPAAERGCLCSSRWLADRSHRWTGCRWCCLHTKRSSTPCAGDPKS